MSQVMENKPTEVVGDGTTETNVVKDDNPPEQPQVIDKSVPFTESEMLFDEEAIVEEEETESEVFSSSDGDEAAIAMEEEHYMMGEHSSDSEESFDADKFAKSAPPMKRKKIPKTPNFFDIIGRIPDIDQISLTESLKRELAIERGELVIPEPIEEVDEEVEEEEEEIAEPSEVEYSTEFSDMSYDFESSEEEEVAQVDKRLGDENLFEALIKAGETPVVVFEEFDIELYERMLEVKQIKKDTYFFMRSLIDAVVEFAEYVDPREALRIKFDKVQLFKELIRLLGDIHVEGKINQFLNTKVVMYHRRIKSLRQITPDKIDSENYNKDMNKFIEATAELDQLLGKLACNKEAIIGRVHIVEEELLEVEKQAKHDIHELETLIRKTFNRRAYENLSIFVERRIKDMASLRKEISNIRRILILHQHNKGNLLAKMAKLENITETLHLSDYERMVNEEFALQKKMEEKQERLERTRLRFGVYTNAVAHMRERQSMLHHTILVQREVLEEVETQKHNMRTYIFQLKTNRVRVKKQIRELSTQSGLIDKPELCIDFDQTVDRIAELKAKINGFKEYIKKTENKILYLQENRLSSVG